MSNDKLSPFQLILFVVIVFLIIGGVMVFALKRQSSSEQVVPITVWGTLSGDFINSYQEAINDLNGDSIEVTYEEFPEDEFEDELVSALAAGEGPDAVIFSEDLIVKHENKLFTIGYDFYNQSDFRNNFIESGEILLKEDGVLGIPFIVDPLVLYWNRTILNANGISQPPEYWEEFLELVPQITRSDSSSNISTAALSIGEFRNINNAKEIFTTLVQQAGNPIVTRDEDTGNFVSIFEERLGYSVSPADAAINFFTQFSDPTKNTYTWNRSLPQADEMFLSGDLAFYIGFASERNSLVERNPNLNFGITQLPQSRSSQEKHTGGKMYFLGILNRSENIGAAYDTFIKMTNPENMSFVYDLINLPSVRRDLLAEVPSVDYRDTFNKAALITKPFIDPDSERTDQIFQNSIESVISGRFSASEAIKRIDQDLDLLIND
ncbi:MAG: extracellular solute-binding protein [bacterium]